MLVRSLSLLPFAAVLLTLSGSISVGQEPSESYKQVQEGFKYLEIKLNVIEDNNNTIAQKKDALRELESVIDIAGQANGPLGEYPGIADGFKRIAKDKQEQIEREANFLQQSGSQTGQQIERMADVPGLSKSELENVNAKVRQMKDVLDTTLGDLATAREAARRWPHLAP